ncbi:hypothetical protein Tco_0932832 [Tanacetum coccineum]
MMILQRGGAARENNVHEAYDIRATNIILQGLPPDVFSLVNHHTIAKEMWDRVKLLIEVSKGHALNKLYGRMFPEESDEVEKYVGGLSDMIQGSVMVSKPKTMQDAIEFATELMD